MIRKPKYCPNHGFLLEPEYIKTDPTYDTQTGEAIWKECTNMRCPYVYYGATGSSRLWQCNYGYNIIKKKMRGTYEPANSQG